MPAAWVMARPRRPLKPIRASGGGVGRVSWRCSIQGCGWCSIEPRNPGQQQQRQREHDGRGHDQRIRVRRAGIGRDLIPQRIEPEPGLTGIIAGLVHHAPLRADEMEARRRRGQGRGLEEENAPRVVRGIDTRAVVHGRLEEPRPAEVEQPGQHGGDRAIAARGELHARPLDARLGQRGAVGGLPARLPRRGRVGEGLDGARHARVQAAGHTERPQRHILGCVDGDMHAREALQRDGTQGLHGAAAAVVGRSIRADAVRAV